VWGNARLGTLHGNSTWGEGNEGRSDGITILVMGETFWDRMGVQKVMGTRQGRRGGEDSAFVVLWKQKKSRKRVLMEKDQWPAEDCSLAPPHLIYPLVNPKKGLSEYVWGGQKERNVESERKLNTPGCVVVTTSAEKGERWKNQERTQTTGCAMSWENGH